MTLPPHGAKQTAIVTGASSGIGEAIARELAGRGHHITLVARSAEKLVAIAADLEKSGGSASVLAADLSDRDARAALPGRVTALGRTVNILVNNAGLSTSGPVTAADVAAELNMIEIDVAAVADLTTRFLPGMVERRSGAILNVASTGAFQPLPGQAGYGACKAFVLSYTQSLHGELRGAGVTATALCPGPVHTAFEATAGITAEEAEDSLPPILWQPPADVARIAVDALAAGKMVAIPGLANRVLATFGHLAPRRMLVRMLARQHPRLRA